MAEAQHYTFDYKEIVEALIKKQGIHEGLWGIYMEFGLAAANANFTEGIVLPAAIIPIVKIGIQRFAKSNNLTVDAAEVNPRPVGAPTAKTSAPKPRKRVKSA